MTLEAIGFGLTVAGFAKALPEILKCAQDILESKQNSHELKRQKKKFDHYVFKVELELKHLLRIRPRPVPRDLLRASLVLVKYCKERIVKAETFYKRFEADPWTFRFITHMARVFGKDRIRLLKRRLREGEDWLRIALAAVALYGNFEPAREDIETRRQYRQRAEQLRHDLERAQRYRKDYPGRMKHMNKARVDYRCIDRHAHAIANHPMFEGSELSSSSMTISTSPSGDDQVDLGIQIRHSGSRNMYQRAGNLMQQGLRGYPVSAIPEASGAPVETWVNARYEPAWTNGLYRDPRSGRRRHLSSSYLSSAWNAPLQHELLPQPVQPTWPSEPPSHAHLSRQRQHARVINAIPGHTYQNDMYRPDQSVRAYLMSQAAPSSRGSHDASSAASRSTYTLSQGPRAPSQQQGPPLQHRRTSSSPTRPSCTSSRPEMPVMAGPSRGGVSTFRTPSTSVDGGQDPVTSHQVVASTPHEQHRRPGPKTDKKTDARRAPYIHVETRSSSRSRSSSYVGSSPSTTFSRATKGPSSSASSSPATSFSVPSAGSNRDSGYSSGGSVCESDVEKGEQRQRPADSHYPPNSHETRRGGYEAVQDKRRSRRERTR